MLPNSLTIREYNILILLKKGYTQKEMVSALGLSLSSIKFYTRLLYARLDVHTACHALIRALQKRWILLDEDEPL